MCGHCEPEVREDDVDADRMQDEAREDAAWERETLRRHLDGGLAPDAVAEARVAELDRKLGSRGEGSRG